MERITYYVNRFIESTSFIYAIIGLVIIIIALIFKNKMSRLILNVFSKFAIEQGAAYKLVSFITSCSLLNKE